MDFWSTAESTPDVSPLMHSNTERVGAIKALEHAINRPALLCWTNAAARLDCGHIDWADTWRSRRNNFQHCVVTIAGQQRGVRGIKYAAASSTTLRVVPLPRFTVEEPPTEGPAHADPLR
jgi:hypothetical protein